MKFAILAPIALLFISAHPRGHAQWVSKKSREIDLVLVGELRAARADALKQARAYCEGRLKPRKVLDVRNRTVHYNCLSGD